VKTSLQYLISAQEKNFVCSDDHLATHYSSESATALLAVRSTQNEDAEDEEEEERGQEAAREQDISMKIRTYEQALHCISQVMQFAIDSHSSSLPELQYTVKHCIQNDMITKNWKQDSLLDLWKKSQ
jgi:hypothetical protein